MQQVNRAQLENVLKPTSAPLAKPLLGVDLRSLILAIGDAMKRWPSQDQQDSAEAYLEDFERLAQKYSTSAVIEALSALRISPEQRFFPRPDEIATEIEIQIEKVESEISRGRAKRQLAAYDADFWVWVECQLEDNPGVTEQEFLDSVKIPGYIGLKAREKSAA